MIRDMPTPRFDSIRLQIYHPPPMGQSDNRPERRHFLSTVVAMILLVAIGCERSGPASSAPPSTKPTHQPNGKSPTVASLSPAATDIVVAIGATDHLLAVSNYDRSKPAVAHLPGAGDYLTVDWERLAELRPDVLIVQVKEAAAPQGFKEKASRFGIKPVFIHIDDLDDIAIATKTLGDALAEPEKAADATLAMREKLIDVARSVAEREKVRTLIVTDEVGAGVAGTGTFLDDLLTIAGGSNAAASEGAGYPRVDREKIIALQPQAVLHLLPDKPAPAVADAKRFWDSIPNIPAVKDGRIYVLTETSVMHPGLNVGDVAALFADRLHPDRSTAGPASRPASRPTSTPARPSSPVEASIPSQGTP